MATKKSSQVVKDDSLYVIFDSSQGTTVASEIEFNDIESEVLQYLEDNGYCEDDVELEVYKSCDIRIEISTKPVITVKRI